MSCKKRGNLPANSASSISFPWSFNPTAFLSFSLDETQPIWGYNTLSIEQNEKKQENIKHRRNIWASRSERKMAWIYFIYRHISAIYTTLKFYFYELLGYCGRNRLRTLFNGSSFSDQLAVAAIFCQIQEIYSKGHLLNRYSLINISHRL